MEIHVGKMAFFWPRSLQCRRAGQDLGRAGDLRYRGPFRQGGDVKLRTGCRRAEW